jgi:6-phosphogluconolactonase (cycloisomerase 2 family)
VKTYALQILKLLGTLLTITLILNCGCGGNAPSLPNPPLIKSFALVGTDNITYTGVIEQNSISVSMPESATGNIPAIFTTQNVESVTVIGVPQVSSQTTNNFIMGTPVVYTVCKSNNQCSNYTVNVLTNNNAFRTFSILSTNGILYPGTISESNITVALPDSAAGVMTATFATDGAESVLVNNSVQVSGVTSNNFVIDESMVYSVVAYDGSHKNYNIILSRNNDYGVLTPATQTIIGESLNAADIAINPNNQYLYIINNSIDAIISYQIGINGSLESIATNNSSSNPYGIAVSPNGKFASVLNQNDVNLHTPANISVYGVEQNGSLTLAESIDTESGVSGLAIAPDNTEIYVTNEKTNQLLVYGVNEQNQVTLKSSITTGGIHPGVVFTSPDGRFLYVINSNVNINLHDSKRIHTNNPSGSIAVIDRDQLTIESVLNFDNQPTSIAITADGKFAYVTLLTSNSEAGKIAVYNRDITTGILSKSNATVLNTGVVPYKAVLAANGRFIYVTNMFGDDDSDPEGTGSVSMYLVHANGSISYARDVEGHQTIDSGGIMPMTIATTPDGRYIYVSNVLSSNIQAFTIN